MFDHLNQLNNSIKQDSKNKDVVNIEADKKINFLSKATKVSAKKKKKAINLIERDLHYPKKDIKSKTPKQSLLIKLSSLFHKKNQKTNNKDIKVQFKAEKKNLKLKPIMDFNKFDNKNLNKLNHDQSNSKNNITSYSTFKPLQLNKTQKDLVEKKDKDDNTTLVKDNPNSNLNEKRITNSSTLASNKSSDDSLHQVKQQDESVDDDALEVNLLPVKKRHFSANQIVLSYFMIIIICLLVSITPYVYFYTQNKALNSTINSYKEQINSVNNKNKILSSEVETMKPFSIKLENLLPLLNNHIYWSNFFPILENYTIGNIYYISLDVKNKSTISLAGKALSLRDLAEQLVVLQQDPNFSDVVLDNFSFVDPKLPNDPKIKFSLSYILSPAAINDNQSNKK